MLKLVARSVMFHVPVTAPDKLLVKVECISLNPIDPLYVQNLLAQSGRVIGERLRRQHC